jgi:hypothetical protein
MKAVQVTCRHCGTKILLAAAGEHLAECDSASHVHASIKSEFDETLRRLRQTAKECSLGAAE